MSYVVIYPYSLYSLFVFLYLYCLYPLLSDWPRYLSRLYYYLFLLFSVYLFSARFFLVSLSLLLKCFIMLPYVLVSKPIYIRYAIHKPKISTVLNIITRDTLSHYIGLSPENTTLSSIMIFHITICTRRNGVVVFFGCNSGGVSCVYIIRIFFWSSF